MRKKPVVTKAQASKKGIAVGVAIRPESCLIRYGFTGDNKSKNIPGDIRDQESCLSFLRKELGNLSKKYEIESCIFSIFGDVDSKEAVFRNTSVKSPNGSDWKERIDFRKLMEDYVEHDRVFAYNDAGMAGYSEFQSHKATVGNDAFLLILVRPWGIGCGVVFQKEPWSFGRSTELGHILAVRRSFPGDPKIPGDPEIKDIDPETCRFHTSTTGVSCVNNLASGAAAEVRDKTEGLRSSLQKRFGGGPEAGYEFEAFYLAQVCVTGAAAFSPQRIVVSGEYVNENVIKQISFWFKELSNGFPDYSDNLLSYADMKDADVAGALQLAQDKAQAKNNPSSTRTTF